MPKLKKFQLQYSTGSDFLRFFTVFFQIKKLRNSISTFLFAHIDKILVQAKIICQFRMK